MRPKVYNDVAEPQSRAIASDLATMQAVFKEQIDDLKAQISSLQREREKMNAQQQRREQTQDFEDNE